MRLHLKIARRYLFAKRSMNAINIISGISVLGITIGTAALIIVLSIFNGFGSILIDMYGAFNPSIKVTPKMGKVFNLDSTTLQNIKKIEGVDIISKSLEETAFFTYNGSQAFGIIKGVDEYSNDVIHLDTSIYRGNYILKQGDSNMCVIGRSIRNKLSINIQDEFTPLTAFMPKKETKKDLFGKTKPFKSKFLYPGGVFAIEMEVDAKYIITELDVVRQLLGKKDDISAIEIKTTSKDVIPQTIDEIRKILGDKYEIRDSQQQQESFIKLMNIEKWLAFAIINLVLILVAFNLIGSLWMIVLEKKKDIAILKSMGATDKLIRNIFLSKGLMLSFIGLFAGFVLALIFYFLQKTIGIITLPPGSMISAYPISLKTSDFIAVGFVTAIIGFLASWFPSQKASQISAQIRE